MNAKYTWQDIYDGVWALFEGSIGGGDYLIVTTLESAPLVMERLMALTYFKGNLYFYVLPEAWATPVYRAVVEIEPVSTLLIDTAGVPFEGEVEVSTGLRFQEEGRKWTSLGDCLSPDHLTERLPLWMTSLGASPVFGLG